MKTGRPSRRRPPARPAAAGDLERENRELRKKAQRLEQEKKILRRATAYFARDVRPRMMYPLVLDLAADSIPVAVTCQVLGFSKQAFYKWKADPVSQRDWDTAHLTNAAIDVHHDDPEFGYRFIPTSSPCRVWKPAGTG